MQIKILFDSVSLNNKFSTGWGVSFLINEKILFDTGEESALLLKNIKNMGINISKLKAVVISHDHWDHQGGLWGILKENPKLKVYACPHFSKKFKDKVKSYKSRLIEADKFIQIYKDVYSTGEIEGRYASKYISEQALVLKTLNGLTIITGCAHPGIIKIIEHVKQNISGNIYLVIGGFHLMNKYRKTIMPIVKRFKELNVKIVAPTHCTGKSAIRLFEEKYGVDFIKVKVGKLIEV